MHAAATLCNFSTVDVPDIVRLWCSADAVCFDVDSTISPDEGIEVLANFCDLDAVSTARIKQDTTEAMEGRLPFETSLRRRLALIQPSRDHVEACLKARPPRLTNGITTLVDVLHTRGVAVYLVSGGFHQMIEPLALALRIPPSRVYANTLVFDKESGACLGLLDDDDYTDDQNKNMSKNNSHHHRSCVFSKAQVLGHIVRQHGHRRLVMVGDGTTDMDARPPAHAFIGYGGSVVRPSVRDGADWFVTHFDELLWPLLASCTTVAPCNPSAGAAAAAAAATASCPTMTMLISKL